MLKLYDTIPDMECLQGDTLPSFEIELDEDTPTGGDMYLLISKKTDPAHSIVQKKGTYDSTNDKYIIEVEGTDTAVLLEGTYVLNFVLVLDGCNFKKLSGKLYVKAAPTPAIAVESEE